MREALKFINRTLYSPLIGAEVGVRAGNNAINMIESMNIERLFLIDHYQTHKEASGVEVFETKQREYYKTMFERFFPHLSKVTFVSMPSLFAASLFADEYFDFVYIDGDHSFDAVTHDLNAWFPKIKKGGILCGHDFNNERTPEVAKAVVTFCKANNLKRVILDDIDWVALK